MNFFQFLKKNIELYYNMDSIIKMETFYKNTLNGVLIMDISTYDISYLDYPNCEYTYTKDVFKRLHQHLVEHKTQPKYEDKVMFHDIYFKNNKSENSPSQLELSPIWYSKLDKNWIFNYLFYKVILNMETVPLLDSGGFRYDYYI